MKNQVLAPASLQRAEVQLNVGIPYRAVRSPTNLRLECAGIAADQFSDPFFSDTITRLSRTQSSILDLSKLELRALGEAHRASTFRQPSGFIFQISRCGSTALANILRSTKACYTFSEVNSINDVLLPPYPGWADVEIEGALKAVVGAIGALCGTTSYVVKFRSWNCFLINRILAAFPETPWIFLIRDPVEVAVSVLRKPPTWLRSYGVTRNPFLQFLPPAAATSDRETYVAHVLAAYADAAALASTKNGQVLQYKDFGMPAWRSVIRHFDLYHNNEAEHRMAIEGRLYSKDATRTTLFSSDVTAKQEAASSTLRSAIDRITVPSFERLLATWRRPND